MYDRWVASSPLERLHIQADVLADRYRTGRYSRVDQRAVSLAAVGSELKEDLISLRPLGTSAIVFRVITKYQPGGSSEKQQLLSFLVSPDAVTTASGAVKGLRKWRQWIARALELRVSVPDPSLQLRALDKLSPPLGPSAAFRVQTFRSQTLLDQAPSEASVYQFSEQKFTSPFKRGEQALFGVTFGCSSCASCDIDAGSVSQQVQQDEVPASPPGETPPNTAILHNVVCNPELARWHQAFGNYIRHDRCPGQHPWTCV